MPSEDRSMTQSNERLIDLAVRCEQASGSDCALDAAIMAVFTDEIGGRPVRFFREEVASGKRPIAFTASLDAAMTLVPEGWGFKAEHNLGWPTTVTVGHVGANKLYDRPEGWAQAATPALALCAAALRARAHLPTTEDDNG